MMKFKAFMRRTVMFVRTYHHMPFIYQQPHMHDKRRRKERYTYVATRSRVMTYQYLRLHRPRMVVFIHTGGLVP